MVIAATSVETDILDAAQNAAASAAEIIDHTAQQLEGHEAFYEHPTFWVAVSFVLAVVFLAKPVGKILHGLLVKRIDDITRRIHDAAALRDDAQNLLVEYEKKFLNAEKEAKAILKKSQKEIEFIKQEKLEKLEREMKIKQDEAANRILSAQNEALRDIADLTAEMTIRAVKTAAADKLNGKAQDKMIDASISLLSKI